MNVISKIVTQHYKKILLLSILICLMAIFFISKLSISSDFDEMLPEDSEALIAEKTFSQYFPSQDHAIVVVKGAKTLSVKTMIEVKNQLMMLKSVEDVMYKIDFSVLNEQALLYVDLEGESHSDGEYFSNEEETVFIMFVRPNLNNGNFVEERATFYKDVKSILNTITEVEVGLTGGAFIQDYEADTVAFEGMGPKVLFTLGLIVLFVMIVFKRIMLPMLTIYPLTLGALLAGAFAYVLYGSLNMFSVSFAMLLLGLGIDFGIHLLARMLEYDLPTKEAIRKSLKTTGNSIIVGALTTGVAFLAFVIAKFKAFEQMGIISGIGVLLLATTMIFILPASLMMFKNFKRKPLASTKWLEIIIEFVSAHKKVVLGVCVLIVVILSNNVMNTQVVGDMDKIYPQNMPSKYYEKIIESSLEYDVDTLTLMLDYDDETENTIDQIKAMPSVKQVTSIYDFMPVNQSEKIDYYQTQGIVIKPLSMTDLPNELVTKYISQNKMIVEIVPNFNVYDQIKFESLIGKLKVLTGNQPVGIAPLMNEVIKLSTTDIFKISVLCVIMIFILLLLMFKNLKKASITILPILLTVYTCIGLMPLIKCDINIFSIAAFPLILGIGIDGGIHLMHRLTETNDVMKISKTAQAIFITSITTMIGFGSLGFINHPGMANLGITVGLGMVLNFVFTLIIIPCIMLKSYKK